MKVFVGAFHATVVRMRPFVEALQTDGDWLHYGVLLRDYKICLTCAAPARSLCCSLQIAGHTTDGDHMHEQSTAQVGVDCRQRRTAVIALGVAGFVIVLASVAFACVPWKGEMTVTGQTSGNTMTVLGSGTGMSYCSGSYPALAIAQNELIDVSVAPGECDGQVEKLREGEYIVSLTEGGFLDPSGNGQYSQFASDCMPIDGFDSGTPTHQFADTFSVGADGTGGGTYDMSEYFMLSNQAVPHEAGAICATIQGDPDHRQGHMMPLTTL